MDIEIPLIAPLDNLKLGVLIQTELNNKTKPLGSLGQLESLAKQLGLILNTPNPILVQPQLVVFAGDHGLTAQGISAFPSDVTWQMVENFLAGGAAVSVLSRQHQLALTIVDTGVAKEILPRKSLIIKKLALGTADSSQALAMQPAQCLQAIKNGQEIICNLPGNVLLLGEMGIGNTAAASLIMSRLLGIPITNCTGAGTGLDKAGLLKKINVLEAVLKRHPQASSAIEILSAFGGFEIATMVGAILQAAAQRRVIVVDGFITSTAVLIAQALEPNILQYCIFSHCSHEQAHAQLLHYLNVQPLLDLDLRLGEGSGAALAWPLLISACHLLNEMASFSSAQVSTKNRG